MLIDINIIINYVFINSNHKIYVCLIKDYWLNSLLTINGIIILIN